MSAEVWSAVAAVASTVTAAVALVVAVLNRRRDLARTEQLRQETLALDEAIRLRAIVRDILGHDSGERTVMALDEADGKTEDRKKFLRRTAGQLKIVGAPALGAQLDRLLEQSWGAATTDAARELREEFIASCERFNALPEAGGASARLPGDA